MKGPRWKLMTLAATAAWLAMNSTAYGLPGITTPDSRNPASSVRSTPPRWLGDIPGLGQTAPDTPPARPPVNLTGCTQTLGLFRMKAKVLEEERLPALQP